MRVKRRLKSKPRSRCGLYPASRKYPRCVLVGDDEPRRCDPACRAFPSTFPAFRDQSTMPLSARILLVTLCGLVAACDSAEPGTAGPPTEAPAFIGTWTSYTSGSDTYATLSQSQIALDPFSPARGEVRIEGAFSSVLRYVIDGSASRDGGNTVAGYKLTSAPRPVSGTPFVTLGVSSRPNNTSIGVFARAGEEGRAYFPQFPLATPPVTQSGDTLRIGPRVYTESSGTGASVTAQGTLVLPRRRIEVGVETHMSEDASVANRDAFTRTFRADGTFLDQGPSVGSRPGTWSAGPDSTLTFRFDMNVDTRRYRVTGNTLRLFAPTPFSCDAECKMRVEDKADLLPGSVRSARIVVVSTFARGGL